MAGAGSLDDRLLGAVRKTVTGLFPGGDRTGWYFSGFRPHMSVSATSVSPCQEFGMNGALA